MFTGFTAMRALAASVRAPAIRVNSAHYLRRAFATQASQRTNTSTPTRGVRTRTPNRENFTLPEDLKEEYKKMHEQDVTPSQSSLEKMIKGYAILGDVTRAKECYDRIRRQKDYHFPDLESTMTQAYCNAGQHADYLAHVLSNKGVEGGDSRSQAVRSYMGNHNEQEAQRVIQVAEGNLDLCMSTYSGVIYLLKSYVETGQIEKAYDTFKKIGRPGKLDYVWMVDGFVCSGDIERATDVASGLKKFPLVDRQGVAGLASIINIHVLEHIRKGNLERAFQLLEVTLSAGVCSNLAFGSVINAYVKAGSLDMAYEMLKLLRSTGATKTTITNSVILSAYLDTDTKKALDIADEMKANNMLWDAKTHAKLLEAGREQTELNHQQNQSS